MRLRFVTSTPLEVSRGSGTFVGITTLARSLEKQGSTVEFITPKIHVPIYTLQRLLFNESLRFRRFNAADITVGFDMDGYALSKKVGLHVASIKGVIADEMRFESGLTRATMRIQAGREKMHVHVADAVITTTQYSARRIQQLYELKPAPHVVPELIDLDAWNELLQRQPPSARVPAERVGKLNSAKFVVLSVCRFYPRKRLHVLLRAAARLRDHIPQLEVRIVGGGPEAPRLKAICREENLEGVVTWRPDISQAELAAEYRNCDVFCLPSVQEGFGIVFLEAMASGKPVVAARATAVPEVVAHGLLVEPDNDEALAAAIERLHSEPALRGSFAAAGLDHVKQFDAPVVAGKFLRTLESLLARR